MRPPVSSRLLDVKNNGKKMIFLLDFIGFSIDN